MKIPNFVAKLAGRLVGRKIDLKEGPLDGEKKWYQSKNIWTSVVTGLIGIYLSLVAGGVHLPAIPEWLITFLAGIGIYTRMTATDKIA